MKLLRKINVRLQFKLNELYVGLSWKHIPDYTELYINLLPVVGINISIRNNIYNTRTGKANLLKLLYEINSRIHGPKWMPDLEYQLWVLMQMPDPDRQKHDFLKINHISRKEFIELKQYSLMCKGWYKADSNRQLKFIKCPDWKPLVEQYRFRKNNEIIQVVGKRVLNRVVVDRID